jgi:hypothetical protein
MTVLAAYRIDWTEYEKGFGTRPDGTTLHRNIESARAVIERLWNSQEKFDGPTPDEYTRPSSPRLVEVDEQTHERLQAEDWFWLSVRVHPAKP